MEGRFYHWNDMVKADSRDCKGCSDCCRDMGESILLDPYDIWQLEIHLHVTFATLMEEKIALHVEEGLILPHLSMAGEEERCGFLNAEGRCAVHAFRPGLCRLFPLGRNYADGQLRYFLLDGACKNAGAAKVKVRKWIGVEEGARYEAFLTAWHTLRKELRERILWTAAAKTGEEGFAEENREESSAEEKIRDLNLGFLRIFYEKQYEPEDFYGQFAERLKCFRDSELL